MNCDRMTIKELFPACLAGTLSENDRVGVEQHLAECGDCAAEFGLLRLMADEPVPDPGEAFWGSLPDRVYREVQRQRGRERSSGIASLFRGALLPRWGWAAAAAAVVILTAWFLVRPLPQRPLPTAAKHRPAPAVDIIQEAANNGEVRPEDLDRLSAWARQELLSLPGGLADVPAGGNSALLGGELNVDIEDALTLLNEEQLETLIDTLDQDVRDDVDEEA